jgi:exopolyphosphatase/guanosine-5'-triphosphate,3'-diphosphate pyrophosphatase
MDSAVPPVNGSGFEVIDAFSRIVRLGEGLDRCGTLSQPAMDRTIDALKVCAAKIRRRRVVRTRNVATEACRRATNCGEFLDRVRWETGLRFEIISCAEEAALALAGCATLLDPGRPRAVVFDIGGGSTELMWARCAEGGGTPGSATTEMLDSISLPFGVINLSENFGGDCVTPADFERMVNAVRGPMEAFEARHGIRAGIAGGSVQMLGTSGTVTTLAGIQLGLPCYDRSKVDGCYLDFTELRDVTDRLLALDCKGRAEQPCIGPSRADLVLAGCAILEAICRTWPVGRLRVADRGVREGILYNLMRQPATAAAPVGR